MEIKRSISLSDQHSFIAAVTEESKIEDNFAPGIFETIFRMEALNYFSSVIFKKDKNGDMDLDDVNKKCWESTLYQEIEETCPQIPYLKEACRQNILIEMERYKIDLSVEKQLQKLLSNLEGIFNGSSDVAKTLNPETIGKLVERLESIEDKSIIDFVVAKQEQTADKPKAKRGRKPGSKNKSKEDKIIHIPGQMSVEDIADTTE